MAIYHLKATAISRGAGKSVTAKAAYNARAFLANERTGDVHDYRRKTGLQFSGIYAPANAPEWAKDRAQLWNAVEKVEKRKDSTLAREYEVSLPHELTDEQRRYLVQDFVKENFTRKGYVADVNIHEPDAKGDHRNHHAHILVTDRRLEKEGFAADKKERQGMGNNIAELERLRASWARHVNHHLERWGIEARVDHRTLVEQGIDREPTQHRGPHVDAMERKGIVTERGEEARAIAARNYERAVLKGEVINLEEERERRGAANISAPTHKTDRPDTVGVNPGKGIEKGVVLVLGGAAELVGKGADLVADSFASLFEAPKPALTQRQPDPPEKPPQKVLKFFGESTSTPTTTKSSAIDLNRYSRDPIYRTQIDRQREEDEARRQQNQTQEEEQKKAGRTLRFFEPDPNDKDRDR
jgi:hypothetical protein